MVLRVVMSRNTSRVSREARGLGASNCSGVCPVDGSRGSVRLRHRRVKPVADCGMSNIHSSYATVGWRKALTVLSRIS